MAYLEGKVVASVADTFCLFQDVRQTSSGEGNTSPADFVLHSIMGTNRCIVKPSLKPSKMA